MRMYRVARHPPTTDTHPTLCVARIQRNPAVVRIQLDARTARGDTRPPTPMASSMQRPAFLPSPSKVTMVAANAANASQSRCAPGSACCGSPSFRPRLALALTLAPP